MRRRVTRVKWLPHEVRKGLSSSQDLRKRSVVVVGVFEPGSLASCATSEMPGSLRSMEPREVPPL